MSWRDEIGTALETWIAALGGVQGGEHWKRVGAARPAREAGAYVVDIRGSDLTADQADNLRLAGVEEGSVRDGFPVLEATVDGELLRLRVAEFAAPAEPYVWRQARQPTFLVTALRDELAALTDAGLANLLARGEVGGVPAALTPPPGLLPAQQDAYRACLGGGLWLVWGPPLSSVRACRQHVSAGQNVVAIDATRSCRCRLRGPSAPGEFAPEFKILAVGLLQGCPQFLDFLAVSFLELADLAGECEHERVSGFCRAGLDGSWAGLGAQALDPAA